MMIPKIIHYCWMGGKEIPDEYQRYMESWKKHFPDYEIKRWDETNFDLDFMPYVREAYDARKYAFVSDVLRFKVLFEEGGIYFDTDVEVINSFDEILNKGAFFGEQIQGRVNPGLGMAAEKGMPIYKEILKHYEKLHYNPDLEVHQQVTIVQHTTDVLKKHGYDPNVNGIQVVAGITIYPFDYFSPQDGLSGRISLTKNTKSIHHFAASWMSKLERIIYKINVFANKVGGKRYARIIYYVLGLPFLVIRKVKSGWRQFAKKAK